MRYYYLFYLILNDIVKLFLILIYFLLFCKYLYLPLDKLKFHITLFLLSLNDII